MTGVFATFLMLSMASGMAGCTGMEPCHNQPKVGCDDYETPAKRLLPNTAKERGELGLPLPEHLDGPKVYTCHFCPYHGQVVQRKRQIMGMY